MKKGRYRLFWISAAILVLMVVMLGLTFNSFYNTAGRYLIEMGESRIDGIAAELENLLLEVRISSPGRQAGAVTLPLNSVQATADRIRVDGKGYGYVMQDNGIVIARTRVNGENNPVTTVTENHELNRRIREIKNGRFEITLNGETRMIFCRSIADRWYAVLSVGNDELFSDLREQVFFNVLVDALIAALIFFFTFLGYKVMESNRKKMEEAARDEEDRLHEMDMLRLEKTVSDTANQAKSAFLAAMSHEIRTPINAVLGMDEMILRSSREEETKEYAGNIKNACRTLLGLINDILDFSRIENGKMELSPVSYEFPEMIGNLINVIRWRAEEKKLELRVDLDPTLPRVLRGDDVRIRQVLTNLLINAVKYTRRGSVTLTVQRKETDGDDCLLYFSVKDTGIGIRESEKDRLFESFSRLDQGENRYIEGNGLGLVIVTRLLDLMGTRLEFESEYGEGSDFHFELHQQIENDEPIGEKGETAAEAGPSDTVPRYIYAPQARVLVIDDREMNLTVMKGLMKRSGIRVDTALSGEEGIALALVNRYQIIFFDHMMPGKDGVETFMEMKAMNCLPEGTAAVVMTANALSGAREEYLKEGFDDYLSKPVETEKLERILARYLPQEVISGRGARRAARNQENDAAEDGSVSLPAAPEQTAAEDVPAGTRAADKAPEQAEKAPKQDKKTPAAVQGRPGEKDTGNTARRAAPPAAERGRSSSAEMRRKEREEKKILDPSVGLKYCMDDPAFYLELIRTYLKTDESEKLEQAFKAENWESYRLEIHSVKSAALNLGARALWKEALERERLLKAEAFDEIRAGHGALLELCDRTAELLEREAGELERKTGGA